MMVVTGFAPSGSAVPTRREAPPPSIRPTGNRYCSSPVLTWTWTFGLSDTSCPKRRGAGRNCLIGIAWMLTAGLSNIEPPKMSGRGRVLR